MSCPAFANTLCLLHNQDIHNLLMNQNPECFLQHNMYAGKKRIQRKIISQFSVER